MTDDDEATSAINKLNESELDGRTIVVKKAKPKEDNNRNNSRSNFNRKSY